MSGEGFGSNDPADNSPDGSRSSKRRRIALACLDCRRRKLKCDRNFPACTRCQRSGHPAECIYDPEAIETIAGDSSAERVQSNGQPSSNGQEMMGAPRPVASPTSFVHHHALDTDDSAVTGLRAHIYRLENRIVGLEKAAHAPHPYYGFHKGALDSGRRAKHHASNVTRAEDTESMMFRGKSFKTQFYGASHHTSYLTHLPKLRVFMNDMVVQHPGLTQVQKELKGTKTKASEYLRIDKEGKDMVALLPEKEIVDQLVHIYVENFEATYRVLHLPSFFDEYKQCLDAPGRARPPFIALLLVMMAASSCVQPGEQSMLRGDSSLARENADHWIQATESWLALQSQKHVNTIIYQIRVVSFIAQRVNAIKRKRAFTSAGILVRIAISAGLHRDAELVNLRHGSLVKRRVTLFDQELRRRIWTTTAELELQTAIDKGMPAMMRDLIIDCGPPLNIDDEKLKPSMDQLLRSNSPSEYTKSSFQHISYSTFALRQEIVSLINGPSPDMPYEEMLQYDRKIMEALDDVPAWHDQSQEADISRVLLQLQLHHLHLLLHRPYVSQHSENRRHDYSAVVHLKAAMSILDLHQTLVTKGDNVLSLMRSDILAAVYGICYNFSISGPNIDHRLHAWHGTPGSSESLQYLEDALSMLENKINRLGVGIQEYYSICAVIGLQEKQYSSADPFPTCEYKAADRVSKMIKRMLSLQDNFSAAATLASLPNMPADMVNGMSDANDIIRPPNVVDVLAPPPKVDQTGILEDLNRDLEGFDVSGWDLDTFFNF